MSVYLHFEWENSDVKWELKMPVEIQCQVLTDGLRPFHMWLIDPGRMLLANVNKSYIALCVSVFSRDIEHFQM